MKTNNKWTVKDVITTVLLTVLLIGIHFVVITVSMVNQFFNCVLSPGVSMSFSFLIISRRKPSAHSVKPCSFTYSRRRAASAASQPQEAHSEGLHFCAFSGSMSSKHFKGGFSCLLLIFHPLSARRAIIERVALAVLHVIRCPSAFTPVYYCVGNKRGG